MREDYEALTPSPAAILCADWGKEAHKRAVYVADVASRTVSRLASTLWSFESVLQAAERWTNHGSVLVTFDAPLGVPHSYLTALKRQRPAEDLDSFVSFLRFACGRPSYFEATYSAADWKVERPFFAVPPGQGGRKGYETAAASQGVELWRAIDLLTRANTLFAKSGIPGSVGSATCALWHEIGNQLTTDRSFGLWPFEGELGHLLESWPVVVGEIYPRAAYATALSPVRSDKRPPLRLAKTDSDVRHKAMTQLLNTDWVISGQVRILNTGEALENEDDFDACVTAAALLRCVLEGRPLGSVRLGSVRPDLAISEGGMLGTAVIDFGQTELSLKRDVRPRTVTIASPAYETVAGAPYHRPCPITTCEWTFKGSRGGWDAHIGSIRKHPHWHPELTAPESRKRQFKLEFPEFFR
jgi:hypothetical protein